jgi:RimJ/RimL family protein N-acetyltransferase
MDLVALVQKAPRLSGELVTLRSIDVDTDTEPFFEMFLDPELHLWTGNTVPASPEASRRELERYRDLPGLISWAVVATEARRLVYDFLFTELQVDEVHAQAWEGNASSCRSMEQAGFGLRRTEERLFAKRQTVLPECQYVLDRDAWLAR